MHTAAVHEFNCTPKVAIFANCVTQSSAVSLCVAVPFNCAREGFFFFFFSCPVVEIQVVTTKNGPTTAENLTRAGRLDMCERLEASCLDV